MRTETEFTLVLREWSEIFMRRSFRDFRRFMETHNLSPSQMGALFFLHHSNSCAVSEVGEHLGVTVPAASQLVDRLVQQGLLIRSEDPNDRRMKQIQLSSQGYQVLEVAIHYRQQWLEQLTHVLTPQEQETVIGALRLLTHAAHELESQTGSDQ